MAQEIQTSLQISAEEARHGTIRSLTLANGCSIAVSVPAGATDGQQLSFALPGTAHEPADLLVLTLLVPQADGVLATSTAPTVADTSGAGVSFAGSGPSFPPASVEATQAAFSPSTPAAEGSAPGWDQQGSQSPLPSGPNWQASPPAYPPINAPAPGSNSRTTMMIIAIVLAAFLLLGGASGIVLLAHYLQVTGQQNATQTAIAIDNTSTAVTQNQLNAEGATATTIARATASVDAANPDPYGVGGKLLLSDPLTSKESSGNPYVNMDENDKCAYKDSSYHVIDVSQQAISKCEVYLGDVSLAGFVLEVKLTLLKGDIGGIFLNGTQGTEYLLAFDKNGNYQLTPYSLFGPGKSLAQGQTSAFHQGYKHVNTIGVVAQGNTFTWYINHQRVGRVSNSNYEISTFDLISCDYDGNTAASEAAYTNLRVWQL